MLSHMRLAIDRLRRTATERAAYEGQWLPEPMATAVPQRSRRPARGGRSMSQRAARTVTYTLRPSDGRMPGPGYSSVRRVK